MSFKTYNPRQYLAIDVANQFGLDKLNFENRIQWVKDNFDELELLVDKAEEPILYTKAVKALKDSYHEPIGHMVGLDSASSGLQLMSVVMRCKKGLELTGLIDPDNRKDAYTLITEAVNKKLDTDLVISRKQAKKSIMTMLYGSTKVPKEVFGDDVDIFYETVKEECTGAYELLDILLSSWNSEALAHSWYLPDGHYAYCPVMDTVTKRIELKDWNYHPSAVFKENTALDFGLSNVANVVHSIDAYVLRTMVRRCNYNKPKVKRALSVLQNSIDDFKPNDINTRWFKTKMADIAHLDEIIDKANELDKELKNELIRVLTTVLTHEPFDIICIHDQFQCHANHCNQMRFHYKEILAELSESTVIENICNQLYGDEAPIDKGESVAHYIRNSNYGIC